MLLQPIVENALKHGLAAKLGGGEITIRTSTREARLIIEIEDTVSASPGPHVASLRRRHRISNVHERLRVLYGAISKWIFPARREKEREFA